MLAATGVSGGLKLVLDLAVSVPRLALPGSLPGALPSLKNLGVALDPSLLMIGFGALIGATGAGAARAPDNLAATYMTTKTTGKMPSPMMSALRPVYSTQGR